MATSLLLSGHDGHGFSTVLNPFLKGVCGHFGQLCIKCATLWIAMHPNTPTIQWHQIGGYALTRRGRDTPGTARNGGHYP